MPYQKLRFKPGFNKEGSNYSNEGSWYDGDAFRFRNGRPETIGGYKALNPSTKFAGVCRQLFNFNLLNRTDVMFLGTNEAIYLEESTTFNDITPVVKTKRLPLVMNALSPLSTEIGTVFVGINTLPATVKGVSAETAVGRLESVSGIENAGMGQEISTSVGTVTVVSVPVNVTIAGSSSGLSVTTYAEQLTSNVGSVTVVTARSSVQGPIT